MVELAFSILAPAFAHLAAETDRKAAKKLKVLHEGRTDVERGVGVFDNAELPEEATAFTSRRTRKS